MKKSTKGYLFKVDDRGNYIITHEAVIGIKCINKIIGKRSVKGRRTEFEEIEFNELNGDKCRCLIKRKELTPSDIIMLIDFDNRGIRSVQSCPYTEDILDSSLLSDFGIEVLTYKNYFWGDKKLLDVYLATLKDNVTEELKKELEERSKYAVDQCEQHKNQILKEKLTSGISWNKVREDKEGGN